MNSKPIITKIDAIPYSSNMYETTKGESIKLADYIRLGCCGLTFLTIFVRICEKYSEKMYIIRKKKKGSGEIGKISCLTTFLSIFLSPKNLILMVGTGFYIIGWLNFFLEKIDTQTFYDSGNYMDLYNFANTQKTARTFDILSVFFFSLYSIKFLQYFESVAILLRAFKKASYEYFCIIACISINFIGMSMLTLFVYGSYIYEYKNFAESLTMNLKVFIFVENTPITSKFMDYYRLFSIVILILFVFSIKYFLLNLFLPVLIEYYRYEYQKKVNSKLAAKKAENNDDGVEVYPDLTCADSKF